MTHPRTIFTPPRISKRDIVTGFLRDLHLDAERLYEGWKEGNVQQFEQHAVIIMRAIETARDLLKDDLYRLACNKELTGLNLKGEIGEIK